MKKPTKRQKQLFELLVQLGVCRKHLDDMHALTLKEYWKRK